MYWKITEINKLSDMVESLTKESKNAKGIDATLGQNTPNPFTNSTVIDYEINSEFTNAKILVYDFMGEEKLKHTIYNQGHGSFTINASSLQKGTFHYILIVDDFVVDSKIMFLTF